MTLPDADVGAPIASLVAQVIAHFERRLDGRLLALWGLALTPACARGIGALAQHGARLAAYDPLLAQEDRRRSLANASLSFAANRMSALNGADALLIVTGWREFRHVDAAELKERMRTPLIFDSRNLYDRQALASQGVEYHSVTRLERASSGAGTVFTAY